MAIFGFRAQDKDFKKAKKEKKQRLERARGLRSQQAAAAAAPQRPATPTAAGTGTGPNQARATPERSRPVTGGRYVQSPANTPVMVEPRQEYNDPNRRNQPQEVGTKKSGGRTFSGAPSVAAEATAQEQIQRNRAAAQAAKDQLAGTRTPAQVEAAARTGVDPNAPQRSTADLAAHKADALERKRLTKILDAQGPNSDAGKATQAKIDEITVRARERLADTKPSLNERRAQTAANIAERQAGQRQARVDAAQTRADRAGTLTGDARNAAGDAVERARTAAGDTARNRARLDATKTKAVEGLRNVAQTAQDKALGVKEKAEKVLSSSEAPGAERPTRGQQARNVAGRARDTARKAGQTAADFGRKATAIPRAGVRGAKFVATNPGKLALGGGAEALAQFQEGTPLSEIPGNIATSTVQGLGATADELASDVSALEATGQPTGDAYMSHGARGLLNLGEYASDVLGAGFRSTFGPKTFAEAYRENLNNETGFMGRMSERERQAFNERMNQQTGGDFGRFQQKFGQTTGGADAANELLGQPPGGAAPGVTPPPAPTVPGAGTGGGTGAGGTPPPTTETLVPGSDQIGTSGFRRPAGPPAPGGDGYSALGPNGSFMTSASPGAPGGGTFSQVSGPAGPGASVEDNVAAYDRQTAAIRDLRNAQRESQGLGAVGAGGAGLRTGSGVASTGFGERMRIKNMMQSRPDYDPNLTPRQNNSRLANWQAGVDAENVARGIDPRTGAITGQEGLRARFGEGGTLRDQIAAAQLQRQSAKDAFDMQMKTTELGQSIGKEQRAELKDISGQLSSGDPAVRMQGANAAVQAYLENPNSRGGQLMLQQIGRMVPKEIAAERGAFDAIRGWLMGGDMVAPPGSLNPAQIKERFGNAKVKSHPLLGKYIDLGGGGQYFYTDNNPELAMMMESIGFATDNNPELAMMMESTGFAQ